MASSAFILFIMSVMVLAGAATTLLVKFQDIQCVENCDDPDPRRREYYEQPVLQTLQMFLGESLLLLPLAYNRFISRTNPPIRLPPDSQSDGHPEPPPELGGWNVLLLWLPALCEMVSTGLLAIALMFTPASIYQMARSSLVLFVALLSVVFLGRRLWPYQWISLLLVTLAVILLGISGAHADAESGGSGAYPIDNEGFVDSSEERGQPAMNVVLGVAITQVAFLCSAIQYVLEERLLAKYSIPPSKLVALEGFFGTLTILLILSFSSLLYSSAIPPYLSVPHMLSQTVSSPKILFSGLAATLTPAVMNYFGISVTKYLGASERTVTDCCRAVVVWAISLSLGWERWMEWPWGVVGLEGVAFGLIVYGTSVFNGLIQPPVFISKRSIALDENSDSREPVDGGA